MRNKIIALVIILLLVVATGCAPPTRITATALHREYRDDVIKADLMYGGKVLIVSGTVISRGKTGGKGYVLLDSGYVEGPGIWSMTLGIQCNFNARHLTDLIDISAGQTISVKGKNTGLRFYHVVLENSRIVTKNEINKKGGVDDK